MAKEEIGFDQFLADVDPAYQNFIGGLHQYLIDNGCKAKVELKKSGNFVAYTHGKSKRSVANLLFRKKGLIARIYGEKAGRYLAFMDTLPDEMFFAIQKAPVCKRLINPENCNPKCSMGYDFVTRGAHFQKCKNNCFMFDVNEGNNPYIQAFLENEIRERAAQ